MNNIIKYKQDKILTFKSNLTKEELEILNEDINKIDFKLMHNLYQKGYNNGPFDINKLSPCKHIKKDDLKEENLAIDLIKNNQYAIVIMAGGNGSRLGYPGPKGCVKLNIKGKSISLFEIYLNKLIDIYKKYNNYIPLYIMTSKANNNETLNFFKENNYFNYPKDKIKFFIQNELPILSTEGLVLLKDKFHILFGPNGNGDVFKSLKDYGLIKDMKKNKTKYILFMGIDNALVNLADLKLLNIIIKNNYKLVSKTIFKENDDDMTSVFCNYSNRPAVLFSENITKEINNLKENDEYMYRDINVLYHIIEFKELKKYTNLNLEYHRAYKKNSYLDFKGNYITPDKPNTYKYERFIYDAFKSTKEMYLYQIKKDEFMPIKIKEDLLKIESYLNEEI